MAYEKVLCVFCGSDAVVKNGKSSVGIQRYYCRESGCKKTFQRMHSYQACIPGMKNRIVDMAINGSGIRDTARVLSVSIQTVITTIKKKRAI
jgi:transposase-like protein